MTEKPLVSVIIPIYKVEPYLCECVDSVINQTYKNLEIILVDDGSPDKCPEICDEYAQKDSRIKVIHKPNGGLSDARNAGIEVAKGEWISFVDSDDIVNNNFIEVLLNTAINNSCEIAVCGYNCFYEKKELNISNATTADSTHKCNLLIPIQVLKKQFKSAKYVVIWNKLYKKVLFESNIRFPKGRLHEDEFTTYKLCIHASKIADISENLYYYRQRKGSITSVISEKHILDSIDAMNEKLCYIRNYNDNYLRADALYSLFVLYSRLITKNSFNKKSYTALRQKLLSIKKYLQLKRRLKFTFLSCINKVKIFINL